MENSRGERPRSRCRKHYDHSTRTIVAARGKRAFVYSCDKDKWAEQAELPDDDRGIVPSSMMCFDSTAKRFVLCTAVPNKSKDLPPMRLWLYDLQADKWSRPAALGNIPAITNFAGYYDPARNVTVLYNGREMWVWRGKKQ